MARSPDPELRRWWQQLIDSFDPERLSVAQFCHRHDVSVSSFSTWRRKLNRPQAAATEATAAQQPLSAFVPVHVHDAGGQSNLSTDQGGQDDQQVASLFLPGGTRVEIPVSQSQLLLAAIDRLATGKAIADEELGQ